MVAYRYIVWAVAGVCAALSCLITVFMVYKHLRNYTRPNLQRYIVRILYMAPIYSVCSLLALIFIDEAKYFDLVRDCYEAYLLYSFFCLLIGFINEYKDEEAQEAAERGEKPAAKKKEMEYESDSDEESRPLYTMVDGHKVYYGEEQVIYVLKTKPKMGVADGCHPIPTPCCKCKFGTGRTFLRWTKRCILQFVIFKPLLSAITVPLDHYDLYDEGSIDFTKGYVYIAFLENASITISMYFLVLFYHAVVEELAPFRPIAKFLCIKAIILFAFWQSIIVGVLEHYQVFHGEGDYSDENVAASVLDLLICVEMLLISIAMIWIFGHDTYRDPDKASFFRHPVQGAVPLLKNLLDTFDQRDVVKETVKSFKFGSHKAEYLGKAILSEEDKERLRRSPRDRNVEDGSFVGDNRPDDRRYDGDDYYDYDGSGDRRGRGDYDYYDQQRGGGNYYQNEGEGYYQGDGYYNDGDYDRNPQGSYDDSYGAGDEGRSRGGDHHRDKDRDPERERWDKNRRDQSLRRDRDRDRHHRDREHNRDSDRERERGRERDRDSEHTRRDRDDREEHRDHRDRESDRDRDRGRDRSGDRERDERGDI